ncbi:MAG: hypothetical protein IID55_05630 [Proteobacteria bacterium]|nr:hypothetical protein [Pseudomonadota bacterium]
MTLHDPSGLEAPATTIPPVTEADVQGVANMIVTRHGDNALRFAAQQMEHFRRRGDRKEHAIWTRIGMAVGERETAPAHAAAQQHVE